MKNKKDNPAFSESLQLARLPGEPGANAHDAKRNYQWLKRYLRQIGMHGTPSLKGVTLWNN